MSKIAVLKLQNRLKREHQIMNTLDILKQIAVSEFHYLDKRRQEAGELIQMLGSFFHFYKVKKILPKFALKNSKISAVVAITSDEGFLGALNNQIIEKATRLMTEEPGSELVVLGRQGARKIKDLGFSPVEMGGIPFPLEYEAVVQLKDFLLNKYQNDMIGSVRVIYARCHSFSRQTVEIAHILPFNLSDLNYKPKTKNELEDLGEMADEDPGYVIIEPDINSIIEYTMALCFGRQLYEIFWNSKLSEVAARTIELNERYDGLEKNVEKIKIQHFRASHEVIDTGIREIFSSHHFSKKLKELLLEKKKGKSL